MSGAVSVPPYFLCSISQKIMIEPVIWVDGHTYERSEIERWLLENSLNCTRNSVLPTNTLIPNHAIKAGIETFLTANSIAPSTQELVIPAHFICPLSRRIMEEPVVCSDGKTYEKKEIERWLVISDRCPHTRNQMLQNRTLTPNTELKAEMAKFDWQKYVRKIHKPVFWIFVRTLTSRTVAIHANSDTPVIFIKQELSNMNLAPLDQMRLIYGGKQLEDDRTLGDYNIQELSTLHLTLRLCGC